MSPVLASVSSATRELGSSFRSASRTASEIWSHILSGWPSETDSEVKRKSLSGIIRDSSLERLFGFRVPVADRNSTYADVARDREVQLSSVFQRGQHSACLTAKKAKNGSAPQDF